MKFKLDILTVVNELQQEYLHIHNCIAEIEKDLRELKIPYDKRTDGRVNGEIEDNINANREIKDYHENRSNTIINLNECNCNKVVLVRLCKNAHSELASYLGDDATSPLILIGEIAQMPGHAVVSSIQSGKVYSCLHLYDLEIIPPKDV